MLWPSHMDRTGINRNPFGLLQPINRINIDGNPISSNGWAAIDRNPIRWNGWATVCLERMIWKNEQINSNQQQRERIYLLIHFHSKSKIREGAHGVELRSWGAKAPPFTSGTILRITPLTKGGALAPQEQSSVPCTTSLILILLWKWISK